MVKKRFIIHLDSLDVLDEMTEAEAGRFIKAIKANRNEVAIEMDTLTKIAITPLINQWNRDDEAYERTCERNKANGSKGGRPEKAKETEPNPDKPKKPTRLKNNPSGFKNNPTEPKKPDTDTDTDTDLLLPIPLIAEVKTSAYAKCMDIYNNFIIEKLGVPAKIDALTGKSLKKIIKYLKTVSKKNTIGEPVLDEDIINGFNYLTTNYDKWDKFHQGQLSMHQIESNVINIINSIKNGTANQPISKFEQNKRAVAEIREAQGLSTNSD